MTIKTTTSLMAAMTLAFSAPAFAGETPPADEPTQTEVAVDTETTVVETETETAPLLTAKPADIETEVAGEVVTSGDVYAPTLGEMDEKSEDDSDTAAEAEDELDGDIEIESDIDADLKLEPEED